MGFVGVSLKVGNQFSHANKTTEGLRFMQSARENDERKKCESLDSICESESSVLVHGRLGHDLFFLLKGSVTETQCHV